MRSWLLSWLWNHLGYVYSIWNLRVLHCWILTHLKGTTYANETICPLNVCCSQYGFCKFSDTLLCFCTNLEGGTTEDFCGDNTVSQPSCSETSSSSARNIGYYEGWSQDRACDGKLSLVLYLDMNVKADCNFKWCYRSRYVPICCRMSARLTYLDSYWRLHPSQLCFPIHRSWRLYTHFYGRRSRRSI